MFYLRSIVVSLMALLAGCGSENEQTEIWYFEVIDSYIELKEPNQIKQYHCTVHNGYKVRENNNLSYDGHIIDDGNNEFRINKANNKIDLLMNTELFMSGVIAYEIPSTCSNDAIQIDSVAYVSNTDQTFIFFDYRLVSAEQANIQLAVKFDPLDAGETVLRSPISISTGSSSGHLYTYLFQDSDDNREPYAFYVYMNSKDSESFQQYSSDMHVIIAQEETSDSDNLNTDCLSCLVEDPYP